jgi:hypothetical protein
LVVVVEIPFVLEEKYFLRALSAEDLITGSGVLAGRMIRPITTGHRRMACHCRVISTKA